MRTPENTSVRNHRDLPGAVLEKAVWWQMRLREGNASPALWAQFQQWLQEDESHPLAYAEMDALWSGLEQPVQQVLAEQMDHEPCHSPGAGGWRKWAMAASVMLMVTVLTGWQQDWITQWRSDYVTAVSEQQSVIVADNSRIVLNTDSALAVDFTASERRVRLLKGEAWFEVASDDARPFVVDTGVGLVRVTGTHFNVRLDDHRATVSLDEGRVELHRAASGGAAPTILMPGLQATLTRRGISDPQSFDRVSVTAWMRGQFVFYDTPLGEVVAHLNRYRRGHILVADKALASLRVSGVFSTRDPDGVLELITSALAVRQTRLTDYLVLVR